MKFFLFRGDTTTQNPQFEFSIKKIYISKNNLNEQHVEDQS